MYNVLITTSSFGKYDPKLLDKFREVKLRAVINPYHRKLTEKEVSRLIQEHQPVGMVAGVEPLTKQVLEEAKELKVVSRCGIGLDSVDLQAAGDLEIVVTNTPDGPTIPVAELTLGMILSLLRKIHVADASIRQGEWKRPMGNLLFDKTVGIIGCGRIGGYLAKLLIPFGCHTLGCDPACSAGDCFDLVGLPDLLAQSDIVTLHLPYSKSTHHLISAERIQAMKKGAFLLNASRGGLVDERALHTALKSGHLAGAALDCYEEEPYVGPFRELDNVLLTSHIGSYAKEGRIMMEQQAVENLLREFKKIGVLS